tara:strand:- start:156 stop:614 length:459 start_codon:yes stop_codon:yes gene_type:complete
MDTMNQVDFTENRKPSRPQEGRNSIIKGTIDGLELHEYSSVNKILQEYYNKKEKTIMDKTLGEILNNTTNFFNNSFYSYSNKLLEAEALLRITEDNYSISTSLYKYITALVLFIRDDDNIIYLGILMIILAVLICFFNISRSYENTGNVIKS